MLHLRPKLLSRPGHLLILAGALWAIGAGVLFIPELRDKIGRAVVLGEVEVGGLIPTACREGPESDELVRDATAARCWITVEAFRRLHPALAAITDLKGSAQTPNNSTESDDEEDEPTSWPGVFFRAVAALAPLALALIALLYGSRTRELQLVVR